MGRALEVLSGRVANPGTTITALTVNTGDSFTIRNAPDGSAIYLAQMWAQEATQGVFRIFSNRTHDASQSLRSRVPVITQARPLLSPGSLQRLFAQDALTVGLSGDAAATDVGALLLYYTDLPGIDAQLRTWQEVAPLIVNLYGKEIALTTSATAGDYGGSTALTAALDNIKRNVFYALLGFVVDTAVSLVGIKGADTGNVRVAGPGTTEAVITNNWFVWLSQETGLPCIPILNGANAPATNVDAVHTTASVAINITLNLAELART